MYGGWTHDGRGTAQRGINCLIDTARKPGANPSGHTSSEIPTATRFSGLAAEEDPTKVFPTGTSLRVRNILLKIDFDGLLQNHGNLLNFRGFAFAFRAFSGGSFLWQAVDLSRDPYQSAERLGLESSGDDFLRPELCGRDRKSVV